MKFLWRNKHKCLKNRNLLNFMGSFSKYTRSQLEIQVSDFLPGLVGFGQYLNRSPPSLSEDEISFKDRRASFLANVNVALSSGISYGAFKTIEYLVQQFS